MRDFNYHDDLDNLKSNLINLEKSFISDISRFDLEKRCLYFYDLLISSILNFDDTYISDKSL